MANTYTYSGPGTRWAEGDPTSEDKLNIARINADHVHEALNAIMDTDTPTGLGESGQALAFLGSSIRAASIPSCLVMPADGGVANVTGDGTTYTIVYSSEIFDQGADFSSTTFTAPVVGRYQIGGQVMISNLGSSHTSAIINIVTSNRSYRQEFNPYAISSGTLAPMPFSVIADLDASDTVTVTVQVSGGTKVVYVNQNTSGDCRTWLSIQMIA